MGEAVPGRAAKRCLLLLLVLALLVRLWNIDYPARTIGDEENVIDRALLLGQRGPNPGWFVYPSLFLYLLFVMDGMVYLGGRALGAFGSPADFAAFYFAHPLALHLVGRGLALASGMACLIVTFRVGRAWWGAGVGLVAAGLLAASPVHLLASRMAKPDILMALLLLLAIGATCRYLAGGGGAWIGTAGALVGFATSTKYQAGLGVLWLALAPWVRRAGRRAMMEGALGLGAAGVGFVAGTPFAVLDWPTFTMFFSTVASLMHAGWYGLEGRSGYAFYLLRGFPSALGWPGALLGLIGCGRWLLCGQARERLLAGFVAVFYGWMGYSSVASALYLLPTLPLLALAGSDLLLAATAKVRAASPAKSPWLLAGLVAACLLPPVIHSLRDTLLLAARDTRELAGAWITAHLPPGTRVLSEPYGPFLPVAAGRLAEMIAERERRAAGHGMRLRFLRERTRPGEGFWYYEMPLFSNTTTGQLAVGEYHLDRFLNEGYGVVVLSGAVFDRYRRFPERYPVQNGFFDRVRREGTLIARFDPSTPWCCPETLNGRLGEAAARTWGRPGPTLLIYRPAANGPLPGAR